MANASVLVVEDDRDVLGLIEEFLSESGFSVSTARSGASALTLLEREVPSAILLDLRMSEMDGAEFLRRLRERLTAPPPVVIVSGGLRGREEAEQLGAREFVAKPFELDDLLTALQNVIGTPR